MDQGERDWRRLTKSKYHDSLILLVYWKKKHKMIIFKWSILFVYFFIYKTRRVKICKVFSKFLILETYCSLKSRTKNTFWNDFWSSVLFSSFHFCSSSRTNHSTHELQYLQGQYVLWSAQARAICSVICPRLTLLMTSGIPIPALLSAIHTPSLCLSRIASLL